MEILNNHSSGVNFSAYMRERVLLDRNKLTDNFTASHLLSANLPYELNSPLSKPNDVGSFEPGLCYCFPSKRNKDETGSVCQDAS